MHITRDPVTLRTLQSSMLYLALQLWYFLSSLNNDLISDVMIMVHYGLQLRNKLDNKLEMLLF